MLNIVNLHSFVSISMSTEGHNVSLDTILPAPFLKVYEPSQDPLNWLADVFVTLQNKPQSLTIRPVQTTPMTFDGKSKKFELSEDLFHTIIKMQLAMTEQMKINHFQSLLRKGALQTFRNINSINCQIVEELLVIFGESALNQNPKQGQNTNGIDWHSTQDHEIAGLLGKIEARGRKSFW